MAMFMQMKQPLTPVSPSLPTSLPHVCETIPQLPLTPPDADGYDDKVAREEAIQTALHVLSTERDALTHLGKIYTSDAVAQEGFVNAVNTILKTVSRCGKLIVCGVGKSGKIGEKVVATMNSFGIRSTFLHPTEALHGDLGMIGRVSGASSLPVQVQRLIRDAERYHPSDYFLWPHAGAPGASPTSTAFAPNHRHHFSCPPFHMPSLLFPTLRLIDPPPCSNSNLRGSIFRIASADHINHDRSRAERCSCSRGCATSPPGSRGHFPCLPSRRCHWGQRVSTGTSVNRVNFNVSRLGSDREDPTWSVHAHRPRYSPRSCSIGIGLGTCISVDHHCSTSGATIGRHCGFRLRFTCTARRRVHGGEARLDIHPRQQHHGRSQRMDHGDARRPAGKGILEGRNGVGDCGREEGSERRGGNRRRGGRGRGTDMESVRFMKGEISSMGGPTYTGGQLDR